MRYVLNSISGVILGLAPLLLGVLFSILIYDAFSNVKGIILSIPLLVLSLYAGWKVFKKVQIVGFIELISVNYSTPDLDDIEPVSNHDYRKMEPSEFSRLAAGNQLWCTAGAIRIYGDWLERYSDNVYKVKSVNFNTNRQVLTIHLKNNLDIEIKNPGSVRETSTYLKIKNAEAVSVTWRNRNNMGQDYFLRYQLEEKKVNHASNVNWFQPYYDVSFTDNAFVLFGKF